MKITLEEASKKLKKNQAPASRIFLESVLNGVLPEYFFCTFRHRRRNYSDEVRPGKKFDVSHPEYPFMKARRYIIKGIAFELSAAVENEVLKDPDIAEKVQKYLKHKWHCFKETGWTTEEEIHLINETLDAMIQYIESRYSINQDTVRHITQAIMNNRKETKEFFGNSRRAKKD